jgi:natural product biosynthesis luciferase-like monooxygenase protein
MRFGLMFFAGDENALRGDDRYGLVLGSAQFGDGHGFSSVWLPERHFTPLGSLYPNPAVLHAALAMRTERIGLRAGSVVLPLHDPLRVAEEWAMVDHLSGGRVGVSFASGWNPDDFAFFPRHYTDRGRRLAEAIPVVRALWRGETVDATSGTGRPVRLATFPRPVQPELPVWLTAASNPETFALAGRLGVNLLTHLLDQGVDRLAERVAGYRAARAAAGFDPGTGHVTVMLHTFVGADAALTRAQAREPYCRYLRDNIGLLRGLASSRDRDVDPSTLPERELTEFVAFLYDRFAAARSFIGSPRGCLPLARRLAAIGVDEVACLLDFGPPPELVLANLVHLDELRRLVERDRLATAPGDTWDARDSNGETWDARGAPAAAPGETWDAQLSNGEPRDAQVRGGGGRQRAGVAAGGARPVEGVAAVRERLVAGGAVALDGAEFYRSVAAVGAAYGPAMRCVERVWVGGGEVLGELRRPAGGDGAGYEFPPAVLDNAFLLLGVLGPGALVGHGRLGLPVGFRRLRVLRPLDGPVTSHLVRTPELEEPGTLLADVTIFDAAGAVAATAEGLRMRLVEPPVTGHEVGELCYRTHWLPVPVPPRLGAPGRWLLLVGAGQSVAAGTALSDALRGAGAAEVLVRPVGVSDPEDLTRAVAQASAAAPLRGIVLLAALDTPGEPEAPDIERAQACGVEAALRLVHACLERGDPAATGRVWLVSRGAQPAGGAPVTASGVAQAPLWGFGRVLAAEHPALWGGLLDLAPSGASSAQGTAALAAVLLGERAEDQLALRDGRLLAPRLDRAPELAAPAAAGAHERETVPRPQTPLTTSDQGTWLLAGGLGELGVALARQLVARGVRHLVLAGRRAAFDPDASQAVAHELSSGDALVRALPLDVTDAAAVAALPAAVAAAGLPPVTAVVHLAGVARGATLRTMDLSALRAVTAPKVTGAWLLHRAFPDVTEFLMVSAVASVVGPIGVGAANYAAANAFLDALAEHRRATGRPAVALGYGPWRETGLALREGGLDQLARIGLGSMTTAEALRALDLVLAQRPAQVTVVRLDWATLAAALPQVRAIPQFERLVGDGAGAAAGGHGRRIAAARPAERPGLVLDYLRAGVAAVLRAAPASVRDGAPLPQLGMDSLMALELRNRVEAELGVSVPMVRLLGGVSVAELAAFVTELVEQRGDPVGGAAGAGTTGPEETAELEEREEFTL